MMYTILVKILIFMKKIGIQNDVSKIRATSNLFEETFRRKASIIAPTEIR